MERFGQDRARGEADQIKALSHPVRIKILDLFTKDRGRSLAADVLLADLIEIDRDTFLNFNLSQIAYHRARLQDVNLIPAS